MKALQKVMVMSATYRQSSRSTPDLLERDPDNRLLARGPRFRLPAEVIRDQALAVCGLLDEKIGGPSVRPYQPDGIWDETSVYGNLHNYKHDKGDNLYRRSLYTIWKRTAAPPTHDPLRRAEAGDVPRAPVPHQHAAAGARPDERRDLRGSGPRAGAADAYRRRRDPGTAHCLRFPACRLPPSHRRGKPILAAGLQKRLADYRANAPEAAKLMSLGDAPRDPKTGSVPELAAYTMTASIILNMDEMITKE